MERTRGKVLDSGSSHTGCSVLHTEEVVASPILF